MAKGGKGWRLNWRGKRIQQQMRAASIAAVNEVMADCVSTVKNGGHPGWQNRTGTAERSVQIQDFAAAQGAMVLGRWGSRGVVYMKWLEILRGAALRTSADMNYPNLPGRIRAHYRGG